MAATADDRRNTSEEAPCDSKERSKSMGNEEDGRDGRIRWEVIAAVGSLLLMIAMGVWQLGRDSATKGDLSQQRIDMIQRIDDSRSEIERQAHANRAILEARIEQNSLTAQKTEKSLDRLEVTLQKLATQVAVMTARLESTSKKIEELVAILKEEKESK